MSAYSAGIARVAAAFGCGFLNRAFGIRFQGQALHGLQSRGNGLLIGLGPPHFGVEALIDLSQRGIMRANARHNIFGFLRRSGAGWLSEFSLSVSIHDLDR